MDNSLFLWLQNMIQKTDSPRELLHQAARFFLRHYSRELLRKVVREAQISRGRLKRLRTKRNTKGTLAKLLLAIMDDRTVEHEETEPLVEA